MVMHRYHRLGDRIQKVNRNLWKLFEVLCIPELDIIRVPFHLVVSLTALTSRKQERRETQQNEADAAEQAAGDFLSWFWFLGCHLSSLFWSKLRHLEGHSGFISLIVWYTVVFIVFFFVVRAGFIILILFILIIILLYDLSFLSLFLFFLWFLLLRHLFIYHLYWHFWVLFLIVNTLVCLKHV